MATTLSKPVRRKAERPGGRPLIVTLYPNATIGLREAKRRQEFIVPLSRVYRMGVEIQVLADRAAKQRARDVARAEKGLPPRVIKRKGIWE
jgi:hypothetical protein